MCILCISIVYIWPLKKCHSITIFWTSTMLFFEMLRCAKIPWHMNMVMYDGIAITWRYCYALFQPFVFSPVFELFIYVSDLFLVLDLRVISTRPLVNRLSDLHFATMQLKVLLLWNACVYLFVKGGKRTFSMTVLHKSESYGKFHCCSSLSLSFSYLIVLVSVGP